MLGNKSGEMFLEPKADGKFGWEKMYTTASSPNVGRFSECGLF